MEFLKAIIDAAVGFVRRNPLLCLLILFLAIAAPAVLKGIAVFVLYFILGMLLLGAVAVFMLRWRLRRLQREMEERFGPGAGASSERNAGEGEVRVYRTADAPRRRVADDVGDYVDFEETKTPEEPR